MNEKKSSSHLLKNNKNINLKIEITNKNLHLQNNKSSNLKSFTDQPHSALKPQSWQVSNLKSKRLDLKNYFVNPLKGRNNYG